MEGSANPTSSQLTDVRLIVKSANQQFEDLIVHTEPTWTVRRLKSHLAQVYPSNPSVPEQKLIYSGQLLSDELILKDVLRIYKDVETENHIFHLVYTPKMSAAKPPVPPTQRPLEQKQKSQTPEQQAPSSSTSSAPPMSTSTDGLRRRTIPSVSMTTATQQTPITTQVPQAPPNNVNSFSIPQLFSATAAACPPAPPFNNYGYPIQLQFTFPGHFDSNMIADQQTAVYNWMHQVYNHYMDQCLRMASLTLNAAKGQPEIPSSVPSFSPPPAPPSFVSTIPTPDVKATSAASSSASTSASTSAPTSVPPPDFDGPSTSRAAAARFAPRVIPPVIPPAAQPQSPAVASATKVPPQAEPAPAPAPGPTPAPVPAPAENAEQAQPRFPNIVQEEQENRDWLDFFYSVIRLLALLTLVYFYSSPLRCLVVALIAAGIYLYHIGFFQSIRENLNNVRNGTTPTVAATPATEENAAQPPDQTPPQPSSATEPAAEASDASHASTPTATDPLSSSVTPPEVEPSVTSLIAFVRTFVVSFFASLLPETPHL